QTRRYAPLTKGEKVAMARILCRDLCDQPDRDRAAFNSPDLPESARAQVLEWANGLALAWSKRRFQWSWTARGVPADERRGMAPVLDTEAGAQALGGESRAAARRQRGGRP